MEYRKSPFLVEKEQPYGIVKDVNMHGGSPVSDGVGYKSCGPANAISNNGMTHGPSFADKRIAPGGPDPFAPVKG